MENIEYIDIFDSNNQATGKKASREKIHKLGLRHRTIQIWIYNKKGEILIQLRSKNKKFYPDKRDISVAGHVNHEEDVLFAAIRETQEELGLQLNLGDLKLHHIYADSDYHDDLINNEFVYVYLAKYDDIHNISIDNNEIQDMKLININELYADLIENSYNYVPHGDLWEVMIKSIKDKLENNS